MKCKIINLYKEKNQEVLDHYEVEKPKISAYIISILLALFCISAPLALLINLLVFIDYLRFTIYGLVLCATLLYMLSRKFYLDETTDIKGCYIIYLSESSVLLIILTILYFISWIWW